MAKNSPKLLYITLFFSVHPKLLAFITHGGANSISEAATAGSPLIAIPLFGELKAIFIVQNDF